MVGQVRAVVTAVQRSALIDATDRLAVMASGACLLHCLALPLLFAALLPLGRTSTVFDLRLDYRLPKLDALSVDFGLSYNGRRVARVDNTLFIPERAILNLGGRYRFKALGAPVVLRVQVRNLTNVFGWRVGGGGGFSYVPMRRVVASLAADF